MVLLQCDYQVIAGLHTFLNNPLTALTCLSIRPFDWGFLGDVAVCLMLCSLHVSSYGCPSYCGPLSVIISGGGRNMLNHCAGCWVHLLDNIEIGKSYPCILITSRGRAVYREKRFVICYDDEWFDEEICVEFVTPLMIVSVSRYTFEYDNCVGVSVFDASEMGLLSCRRHAPKPFCEASTSRTASFCEVRERHDSLLLHLFMSLRATRKERPS